eukprot:jgi/Mesvir1/3245/Mv16387-RA.1
MAARVNAKSSRMACKKVPSYLSWFKGPVSGDGEDVRGICDKKLSAELFISAFNHALQTLSGNEIDNHVVLAQFLDYTGKPSDSVLVLRVLKGCLEKQYTGLPFYDAPMRSSSFNMDSAEALIETLSRARAGTIGHLMSKQESLKALQRHVSQPIFLPRDPPKSPAHATPVSLPPGGARPRIIPRKAISEELHHVGSGGCVSMVSRTTGVTTRVDHDAVAHHGYVVWLVQHVYATMERADAYGSVATWHKVPAWEQEMISGIRFRNQSAILEVEDAFSLSGWIQGFLGADLEHLQRCPGVDTDRRILRFLLLAS